VLTIPASAYAAQNMGPELIEHFLADFQPGDVVPDGATVIQLGLNAHAKYGGNYGSGQHPAAFTGAIYSRNQELVLGVRGYDIDHNAEVGVYFQGVLLGYLLPTGNDQEGQTTHFTIDAGQFSPGYNLIEFRVEDGHDGTWGITDISLTKAGPESRQTMLGLPVVTNAEWNDKAVRKVLHTLCYGSKATDQQIQEWVGMAPRFAIEEMITFDRRNEKLSPPSSDYRLPDRATTLKGFLEHMSSGGSSIPVRPSDRSSFNYMYRFYDLWPRMAVAWGLNPCRQRIGFWESNYHLATNVQTEVTLQQMVIYYDLIMDALADDLPYQRVLAEASKSAAVAAQYQHFNNRYDPNTGVFVGNEDFAREIHQLFFGILGYEDPMGIDHHEETTIKNTALALTDMNLDRDPGLGYRRPDYVTFGTENHYPGPLDILNTQIPGTNAAERIDNIVEISINHPESLQNLPIIIIEGLMENELDQDKVGPIQDAWAAMPVKNLLQFIRAYAISTLFHSDNRVRYSTSFDRHVTQVNRMTLNNGEALRIGGEYSSNYLPGGYDAESVEVFQPEYNVFGNQRPREASDNAAIFQNAFMVATDREYRYSKTDCSDCNNNRRWEKDWSDAIPEDGNGAYSVDHVAKWLWNRFLGDGLKHYGPLERAHLVGLLGTRRDLLLLLAVREQRLAADPDSDVSLSRLESDYNEDVEASPWFRAALTKEDVLQPDIATLVDEIGARVMDLDVNDDDDRRTANRRVGTAINFILALPFNFIQEGL